MSAARRLASALAGQWAATLYSAVLSTALSFALGRFLGPEAFGTYSYILTAASLFAILQDGGFSTLIFRETAHPSQHLAGRGLRGPGLMAMSLGHATVATAVGIAAVWLIGLEHAWAFSLAVAYYGLFAAGNYLSADMKGRGLFEMEARWRIWVRSLTVGAVGIALALPGSGPGLLFAGWLAGLAAALAMPRLAAMTAPLRVRPRFAPDVSVYRSCAAFLLISAATTIYFKSDILLLTWLGGDAQIVGQYAAAYRLVEAAVLFSNPLVQIFFRMLRVSLGDQAAFRRSFRRQLAVMCALGVSGTAFSLWAGPHVIRWAFGTSYGPAEELCLWLLPSLAFILPNGVLTQALIALGREGYYARVTVVTAAVNVALNVVLIPWLGAKGSALATVATEALLMVGLALGLRRR